MDIQKIINILDEDECIVLTTFLGDEFVVDHNDEVSEGDVMIRGETKTFGIPEATVIDARVMKKIIFNAYCEAKFAKEAGRIEVL